ncbi:hypothetical protein IACHDJAJ_00050 [Aeromonas phage vB_AdhS_TS3]|nr:hypothetical protein IACHDJAJ_00050 [Aeromonas phage vB_AdhS_TS3]
MGLLIAENIWLVMALFCLALTWLSAEILESPKYWKLWKLAKYGTYTGVVGLILSVIVGYFYA